MTNLPNVWQMQMAKAQFSRLIRAALEKKEQFISTRGDIAAVVMSKKRYDSLIEPKGSLLDFFRNAPLQEVELDTKRQRNLPRNIDL